MLLNVITITFFLERINFMCPTCGQRVRTPVPKIKVTPEYVKICKSSQCVGGPTSGHGEDWIGVFFYRNAATPDGYDYYCKDCRNKLNLYAKLRKKEERQRTLARQERREWREMLASEEKN